MREKVVSALKVSGLTEEEIDKNVEVPSNNELGDYAFPCFALAKAFKKNPVQIASELSLKVSTKDFEKVEAKGPYINFFLKKASLAEETLKRILKEKSKYGSSKQDKSKTMIEFSQANTHKAFHIGHVRGTSLGESIARIFEFSGNKPVRVNYQGDTGMHVAKWIWCYLKFHKNEPIKLDEGWFAAIYTEAVKKLAENESLQSEVDEINRKLDSKEDKKINELWKKTRKVCLDALETVYSDLNTHFDEYFFESEFEKRGKEISLDLVKKKVAEMSDGAAIMRLDNYNLGVWVLLRKDGTVLYSAKDLALAEKKFEDFKIKNSFYIVGAEQRTHFYQLFKTLELAGFKQAKDCKYIPVTEVRLPTGKMSSRTGDNILYSQFKTELMDYAKDEISKREKGLGNKELSERALAIAIASLKYSMLKQDTNKGIIFNKEEALSFDGNSGPYLLYSYARAKSLLKKSKKKPGKFKTKQISEKEKHLCSKLAEFPDIVLKAYHNLAPNIVANYTYELSQSFNEFYASSQIVGSDEEEFRLTLVSAFAITLSNSLSLLGIDTLERM